MSHEFARVLRKAGLPHIRFHDLRHTQATLMLKVGINLRIVSERLGHISGAIILDTYSHVVPSIREAAAQRFDKLLESPDVSGRPRAEYRARQRRSCSCLPLAGEGSFL